MKRLAHLISAAFMAAASFLAAAQTTTVNLSPFAPDQCEAAKAKLGDATLKCASTFTPAQITSTITLSGVPADGTTSRTASITATVTPAAPVWCRLDAWAPIPCPQVFNLGAVTPLPIGLHKVDYYVGGTTAPDASKPTKTASWTIVATPAPPPPPPPPPASAPPPTGTALASLSYPVPTDFKPGSSPTVDLGSTITAGGAVRLQPIADPGGSGQQVYLHRLVRSDVVSSGTALSQNARAEKVWINSGDANPANRIKPGADYWFAFAIRPKSGEWPTAKSPSSDDSFLFMQTHSESNGDTQPPIQFNMDVGTGQFKVRTSYGAASQAVSPSANYTPYAGALLGADQWHKFVVHLRPGWSTSQNPITEVWYAIGAAGYTQIVSSTNPNDYNWDTGSYARIGFYKWAGTNWQSSLPTIAAYFTTLYGGTGANRLEDAKASLAALK